MTVTIKEKPTGNLSLGAGFSSADKLSLTAAIKQDNIFGTGNYLGVEVNTSKYNRTLVLSTVDPYFTIDGISRAFDIYYRTSRPINSQGEEYKLVTPGVALRFGVPFSEYDTVFFGIGAERTEIKGAQALPNSYFLYREAVRRDEQLGAADDRLDARQPRQRAGADRGALHARQPRLRAARRRQVLPRQPAGPAVHLVHALVHVRRQRRDRLRQGIGGRPYPIFKNFYGGGLGTVRGFDQGSLGPVDVTGAFIGGNRRFNLNNELYLPVPGANADRTLRIFLYADAGNVWGENERVTVRQPARVGGLGVSWCRQVGPLKLSYGTPIKKKPEDRIQRLQFQIGTAF
jgi:outer membrane protein insertion porin family